MVRKVAASAPGPKSKRSKVVKPSFWLEISCLGPATSIVKSILSFVGSGSMNKNYISTIGFFLINRELLGGRKGFKIMSRLWILMLAWCHIQLTPRPVLGTELPYCTANADATERFCPHAIGRISHSQRGIISITAASLSPVNLKRPYSKQRAAGAAWVKTNNSAT
jgi:hypothetical protein